MCTQPQHRTGTASAFSVLLIGAVTATFSYISQAAPIVPHDPPPSLKTVSVPPVEGIENYITSNKDAIVLGKALFWDIAMGSDGQACASCHFSAGADPRKKNQLNPNLLNQNVDIAGFFTKPTQSGGAGGPNYTLNQRDFPFYQFEDPNDRTFGLGLIFATNDVTSSAGTFAGDFVSVDQTRPVRINGVPVDDCKRSAHPIFNVNGIGVRKVEPRNTPTMINAVFNFRNFWDGRANNRFNGVSPFGDRDPNASILVLQDQTDPSLPEVVNSVRISLKNSSLASQAVGPPQSDFEAGCSGRTLADIGHKLLNRRALSLQAVHSYDSVLGPYKLRSIDPLVGVDTIPNVTIADLVTGVIVPRKNRGLRFTYADLVQKAFNPNLYSAVGTFPVDGKGAFSQMEANFPLFFGLAIQAYEATLISDNAPYDKFAEGNTSALTDSQKNGLNIFLNEGKCINCHKGPDFTGAGSGLQADNREGRLVERMLINNGANVLYDNGFYNISVTPTSNDIGVGGVDKWGNPLSFTKQFVTSTKVDPFEVNPCSFDQPFSPDCTDLSSLSSEKILIKGAFKVPSLRNVELTGPYMHNGGMATLEQVVQFYNRGGNFDVTQTDDTAKDADIQPIGLSDLQQADLVAFLKSLTDSRVAREKAPFDHPQLIVSNGQIGDETAVIRRTQPGLTDLAKDNKLVIPPVGRGGRSALNSLKPFHTTLAP